MSGLRCFPVATGERVRALPLSSAQARAPRRAMLR